MTHNATFRNMIAAVALAAALAGCASSGGGTADDKMASFLVAPDKFVLFNCQQLADTADGVSKRQKELEALMAKAGPEPSGRLASTIAYEPEYVALRGDANELRRASAEKKCKAAPESSAGSASSNAVR